MMNRAGILILLALCLNAAAAEFPATTITARRLDHSYPLDLQTLKAEVEIDANLASTTLTMTFMNRTDERLEGEIRFPICYDQNPSFFAMDVEGKMRDGVVFERSLARNVFDSLVHWNIDPGLLSWIDGERFSVRMFPIDPNKSKTIVVRYEEELQPAKDPKFLSYVLPLTMPQDVETFQLSITATHLNATPIVSSAAFKDLAFREEAGPLLAETTLRDYRASRSLRLQVPKSDQPVLLTSRASSLEQYFYFNFDYAKPARQRPANPEKICLLWDQSASGLLRNLEAEMKFLTAYFTRLGNVDVELLPFHNSRLPRETFEVRGGEWTELRKRLIDSIFDGGTRFDALNLDEVDCDEILLFSDGAWTLGKSPIDTNKAPVFAIHSSRRSAARQLRGLAIQSGGRIINLRHTTATDAAKMMELQPYRFLGVAGADEPGGPIRSVYPARPTEMATGSIVGLTSRELDEITLEFGYGREVVDRQNLPLEDWSLDTPLAKRIWARKKLAELESRISPAAAVRNYAEEVGFVTEYTSSIVLDRASDYINNRIEPPDNEPQLLAEYQRFHGDGSKARTDHMDYIHHRFAEKRMWWIKDWPWLEESNFFLAKNGTDYLEQRVLREPNNATTRADLKFIQEAHKRAKELRDEYTIRMDELRPKAYEAWLAKALQLQSEIEPLRRAYGDAYIKWVEKNEDYRRANQALFAQLRETRSWGRFDGFAPADPFASLDAGGSVEVSEKFVKPENPDSPEESANQGVVQILPWTSNAAYLGALLPLESAEELEGAYLQLRKNRLNDPFFYADVGDLLMNRAHEELAIRVLSNIAELGINDVQFLRMLGYRYMALGKFDLAIEVFDQILFLNDDNPHAYRDLALCHIELGEHQQAFDLLWKVVSHPWDEYYQGVAQVALNEMNAFHHTHKDEIDARAVEKSLLRHMPVDLRIVMTWDTDQADVDLVVYDPANSIPTPEKPVTTVGCRITQDMTTGYGPEEYLVHKALPGRYSIRVKHNGGAENRKASPTTVYLEVTKNFGRPNAETKRTWRRVSPEDDLVEIATLVHRVIVDAETN